MEVRRMVKREYSPPVGRASHPMEASSPRIRSAFPEWTHFYRAVSGQFPVTTQQCVKKR